MFKQVSRQRTAAQIIHARQEQQENAVNVQAQPLLQQQPANAPEPQQAHPAAANAVMNQQQQNARNKKERRRQRRVRRGMDEGMAFLETEEQAWVRQRIESGTAFMETAELEAAQKRTMENQVVKGASKEQIQQYGCASYHQTVPLEEAKKAVEASGGFLYYREVAPGIAELRPTLPETVTVGGQKIPLRRTYNLLIREIAKQIVDSEGSLRSGEQAPDLKLLNDALADLSSDNEKAEKNLREQLGNTPEAEMIARNLRVFAKKAGCAILPAEIIGAIPEFKNRILQLGDRSPRGIRARQKALRKKLLQDNGGKELTPEQELMVENLPSMYADASAALRELTELRNMTDEELDGPEVALPNACSGNTDFQARIRLLTGGQDGNSVLYMSRNHLEQKPGEHIQYLITHIDRVARQKGFTDEQKNGFLAEMRELRQRQQTGALTKEDLDKLYELTIAEKSVTAVAKYTYHVANVAGVIAGPEKTTVYTTETFAAESKQYLVTPFTRKAAVGRYHAEGTTTVWNKNSVEGMIRYYNEDNPLPDETEYALTELKPMLAEGRVPGGPSKSDEEGMNV